MEVLLIYKMFILGILDLLKKVFLNYKKKIDVIITTGGTGITGRDVTPEAIEKVQEDNSVQGILNKPNTTVK